MNYFLPNANDKFKYIIFRIPKNANSTLIGRNAKKSADFFATNYITDNICVTESELKSLLGKKRQKYFKYAIIRNPYDRLVSCWKNKTSIKFAKNSPESIFRKATGCSFKNFIYMLIENRFKCPIKEGGPILDDRHLMPQVNFIPKSLDFIGRFESLQNDFDIVCDKIGIPRQQLPHINKTNHKHYTEYYDDETRQIVAEKYAKDIEYFGYKFGE